MERWRRLGLWPASASERESVVGVRVNTLLTGVAQAVAELRAEGVEASGVAWSATALTVPRSQRESLVHSEAATSGRVYVQSLSSQWATMMLGARPGEEVLDLCAAPGGKTLHLAAMMGERGGAAVEGTRLAAVESSRPRFFRMRANLERGGATGGGWVRTYLADGRGVGRKTPERFDRVLLDAPCSADGRLLSAEAAADEGDARGEWSLRKVRRLAVKQGQLLASAVQACRVGGVIVYATCTSAPEENEGVVNETLRRAGEMLDVEPMVVPAGMPAVLESGLTAWEGETYDPRLRHTVRVMPRHGFDVFYAARLRKRTLTTAFPSQRRGEQDTPIIGR